MATLVSIQFSPNQILGEIGRSGNADEAHNPLNCGLPQSIQVSAKHPWHWLVGQTVPLGSILHTSSCQAELLQKMPKVMDALASSSSVPVTEADALRLRKALRHLKSSLTLTDKEVVALIAASVSRQREVYSPKGPPPPGAMEEDLFDWIAALSLRFR